MVGVIIIFVVFVPVVPLMHTNPVILVTYPPFAFTGSVSFAVLGFGVAVNGVGQWSFYINPASHYF